MEVTRREAGLLAGMVLMGLKAANGVVGGTVLQRAAIQSPNFVTGSTGWSINQDGSAEFNNVIIRNGEIISGTALYYNPSPGLGNLVASISATGGTDAFGQVYFTGIGAYQLGSPGISFGIQVDPQGASVTTFTGTGAGTAWTLASATAIDINGNLTISPRIAQDISFLTNGGVVISDFIAHFNNGGAETWHAPSFANSWANTGFGPNLQYRFVAAPYNSMQWAGRINAPAGIAAGQSIISALAAQYRPANVQMVNAVNVTTGAVVRMVYSASGLLQYESGAVSGDNIDLNAIISLDA